MAAQQDNSKDDDDVPVKFQPKAKAKVGDGSVTPFSDDPVQWASDKLGNAADSVWNFATNKDFYPVKSSQSDAPIQYTHSGDAKDMGPPVPALPVKPGQFRPTPTGTGGDDNTTGVSGSFKDKLTNVESQGKVDAVNPDTGAVGKYQFVPSQWDSYFKDKLGVTTKDMLPKDNSPEERQRAEQLQDKAFSLYMKDQVVPGVEQLRNQGLGKQYDDDQLAYLVHHEGMNAATSELKSGKFPEPTKANPMAMDQLLAQFKGGKYGVPRKPGAIPSSTAIAGSGVGGSPGAQAGKPNPAIDWESLGGDHLHDLKNNSDPNIRTASYDFQRAKDALASGDKDDFNEELKKLNANFEDAKDTIAKRELAHTIADALTKMGAGAMGLRSKVDMSHINIGDHDFQKDEALAQNEYKMKSDDLKARREESLRAKEGAVDMGFKEATLGQNADELKHRANVDKARLTIEDLRNQALDSERNANLQFHQDDMDSRSLDRADERQRKMQEATDRRKQTAVDSAAKILASKDIGKDEDRASAAMIALRPLHIDPVALHDAFYKDGLLWGENVRGVDEISKRLGNLADDSAGHPQQSFTATRPDGKKVVFSTQAQAQGAQREYDKQKVQ